MTYSVSPTSKVSRPIKIKYAKTNRKKGIITKIFKDKTKSPVKLYKHNIKKVQDVKRRKSSRIGGGTMSKIFG